MSYYIHNVPGRLRVKSPVIKRNSTAVDELRKVLSTMHGIATVDINPTTGSLLIYYNTKVIKHTDIVKLLERKGYFDASRAVNNDEYIHTTAKKAGDLIGKSLFSTFAGMALEGTPLSFLTILI